MPNLMVEEEIRIDGRKPSMSKTSGVIELVELGRARPYRHAPMVQQGRQVRLGAGFGDVIGFLGGIVGDGVAKVAGLLGDILKVPTDLISTGVGAVLTGFASIVAQIPIIGDFVATILKAFNALAQWVIQLPVDLLKKVATLGEAFKTLSPAQQSSSVAAAIKLINDSAPEEIKPQVAQAMAQSENPAGASASGSTGEWIAGVAAVVLPLAAFAVFA